MQPGMVVSVDATPFADAAGALKYQLELSGGFLKLAVVCTKPRSARVRFSGEADLVNITGVKL